MPEQNKNYQDYFSKSYLHEERWADYQCQVDEILKLNNVQTVLEIGPGNKIVTTLLKHLGLEVTTLDNKESIKPDLLASVEKIPAGDNTYDVILCAEVLEHLPYEKFSQVLQEFKRVSNKYVILSLPHWGRHFSLELRIPGLHRLRWQRKISFSPPKHLNQGEHFWEIGKKGYSLKRIKSDIVKNGFQINKEYIAFESPIPSGKVTAYNNLVFRNWFYFGQ